MNLLKRWRGHRDDKGGGDRGVVKRNAAHPEPGLSRFRDEIDQLFDRFWEDAVTNPWGPFQGLAAAGDWPAVDVTEDDKTMTLRVDVPGLGPEDVDVRVSGNLLTISGARREEWADEGKKGGSVRRRERRFGSFARTMTLPPYVDPANVDARYDKGILTVTAAKVPGKGPRRVKVNIAPGGGGRAGVTPTVN